MNLLEIRKQALCLAYDARVSFAARRADRRLRPVVLAAAGAVGDRRQFDMLLEQARQLCAECAERVGVPPAAVQARSSEVRLLLAFSSLEGVSRTVVVPFAVVVR
jgi:hypothetical protein